MRKMPLIFTLPCLLVLAGALQAQKAVGHGFRQVGPAALQDGDWRTIEFETTQVVEEGRLSPLTVLQAATLNPAIYLGARDSLGTVDVGKIADLVILEANPLQDIENTRRIHAVVLGGRFFNRQALDEMLANAGELVRN